MPNRQRGGGVSYREAAKAKWEADYDKVPPNFDEDEWHEVMTEIGREHGYLPEPPPHQSINEEILRAAGRRP